MCHIWRKEKIKIVASEMKRHRHQAGDDWRPVLFMLRQEKFLTLFLSFSLTVHGLEHIEDLLLLGFNAIPIEVHRFGDVL